MRQAHLSGDHKRALAFAGQTGEPKAHDITAVACGKILPAVRTARADPPRTHGGRLPGLAVDRGGESRRDGRGRRAVDVARRHRRVDAGVSLVLEWRGAA